MPPLPAMSEGSLSELAMCVPLPAICELVLEVAAVLELAVCAPLTATPGLELVLVDVATPAFYYVYAARKI